MSNQKSTLPKGTRDFGPDKMVKRNFIFQTITAIFQKFGFLPIETPALENLSVLTGKYGDEGDQLMFKVLNSGNFLEKVSAQDMENGYKKLTSKISEKGLRYDLTVPFARFVVMNRNELVFPFKRYQIQPVWRADRPQKGRYREFYQCDADVVGTDSLLCEAEIVLMINEVLEKLGIGDFTIKVNNRKVLSAISEVIGYPGKEGDLCVAIDKLDKIGKEGVIKELEERGFALESIQKLDPIFEVEGNFAEKAAKLDAIFAASETGKKGLQELRTMMGYVEGFGLANTHLNFDITLARGLSYYTGAIFEVKVNNVQIGSISGGGRYDNLTGAFGLKGVSGVGFSFGVDRIYDVMEELQLFPAHNQTTTRVMFSHFDAEALLYTLPLLKKLRESGIKSEIYPDAGKLKKQLDYANNKQIPFVVIIGSDEISSGKLTLKNMQAGQQQQVSLEELIRIVQAG
ncbi:histidine--tRNA ligase [Rhodocytophaga rosea]|uniref:Histidine--tRNA ligase n=1 Tax=Rhodocytophaga rosea TaxID=2704465 RepID=A0A6C0GES6_9BACT|nr:histidine--tRNA ligase [Rhodocytophaga rosea]QHT66501.1 histidine--tRNA ligase [Rhodocytophaga rosea]